VADLGKNKWENGTQEATGLGGWGLGVKMEIRNHLLTQIR